MGHGGILMGRKDKIVSLENISPETIGTWMRHERQQKGINLTDMAGQVRYSKSYLSAVENNTSRPSKRLLEEYERILDLSQGMLTTHVGEESIPQSRKRTAPLTIKALHEVKIDMNEAPHVTLFHGRKEQLATLKRWVVTDHCRLVSILGFGGVGKTVLASELVNQIKQEFEFVYWISLKDAPSIETVLEKFLTFLDDHYPVGHTQKLEELIQRLILHLQNHRCLLILDNFESLLQSKALTGHYSDENKGYALLLQRIAETLHQSCLLVTSREKPGEFPRLEGKTRPTRSMDLVGVAQKEGRALLQGEELFGTDQTWTNLIDLYVGNPLTLKLVSGIIREMFGGDIARFLERGEFVFSGGIKELLDQQFHRLSSQEQDIMFWLAIEREIVSFVELEKACVNLNSKEIMTALNSSHYRSLIEARTVDGTRYYTLQPVIMEYVTDQLVDCIYHEIAHEKLKIFTSHALIKAQAEDYVRNNQVRLILEPIKKRLLVSFGTEEIENRLKKLLATLHRDTPEYAAGNILNLLIQLDIELRDYDFSHLTVWQAYLRGINLRNIDFSSSDLTRSIFTDTFGSILSVTYHPDKKSKLLAIGTATCEVRIYEAGIPLTICQGHKDWVRAVAFSPDEHTIVSASDDRTIRLWDITSGQCLQTFRGHTGQVYSVAFSSDGHTIVSASDDQTIRLWDTTSAQCIRILRGHTGAIRSAIFSPDKKIIASAGDDRVIRLWDTATGKLHRSLYGHTGHIYSVAFSPDGLIIASGSEDQTVRLWDINTGQCIQRLEKHENWVYSVTFSRDGLIVASGSEDQTVRLWDINTGQCIRTLSGHSGGIWSVAFSADDHVITSGSDDQQVLSWKATGGQRLQTLQGHSSRVCTITMSEDGSKIGSGGDDQMVRIWDIDKKECLRTMQGHTGRIWSTAFNSDGSAIASGSDDQSIRLWDVTTGLCLKQFNGHAGRVYCVAFSPTKSLIASGGDDHTVRIWDADTGECLKIWSAHEKRVYCIAFSPDGKILASGSDDQNIRLWDITSGQCLQTIKSQGGRIWSIAFSPDGKILAGGSDDQNIRLWDVSTGQFVKMLQGHSGTIWAVTFLQNSGSLMSGGDDQSIRLWDVASSQCLQTLREHFRVRSLASSPDTHKIASCGNYEGTITLWNTSDNTRSGKLKSERPYEGINITKVKGLTEAQKVSLIALGALDT
jgi:WD40 repeat protein/transcriptional regulator with XRE-family HTH domain